MAAWPDLPESLGDLIPPSSGREEGIADRLNRKIERSGRRLETMEERRKTRAAGRATIRKGVWR
jgi:hypothetical protein